MKRIRIALSLGIAMMIGCVDNETTFFVEHVKTQPIAPECSVTESDSFIASGTLDLAFRNSYGGWYLVTNQLLAREDYGNGVAESNGIIIDGMETYVRGTNGALIGGAEYYELESYVEAEDSSIAAAEMISGAVVDELVSRSNCPLYYELTGPVGSADFVYTVVRFLGHTSGGEDVLTPEFSFPVNLCCGCLVDWSKCQTNCQKYCEEPEEHTFCSLGVANGSGSKYDCRWLSYNPTATWPQGPGEKCADPNACSCDDCSTSS